MAATRVTCIRFMFYVVVWATFAVTTVQGETTLSSNATRSKTSTDPPILDGNTDYVTILDETMVFTDVTDIIATDASVDLTTAVEDTTHGSTAATPGETMVFTDATEQAMNTTTEEYTEIDTVDDHTALITKRPMKATLAGTSPPATSAIKDVLIIVVTVILVLIFVVALTICALVKAYRRTKTVKVDLVPLTEFNGTGGYTNPTCDEDSDLGHVQPTDSLGGAPDPTAFNLMPSKDIQSSGGADETFDELSMKSQPSESPPPDEAFVSTIAFANVEDSSGRPEPRVKWRKRLPTDIDRRSSGGDITFTSFGKGQRVSIYEPKATRRASASNAEIPTPADTDSGPPEPPSVRPPGADVLVKDGLPDGNVTVQDGSAQGTNSMSRGGEEGSSRMVGESSGDGYTPMIHQTPSTGIGENAGTGATVICLPEPDYEPYKYKLDEKSTRL